MDGRGRAGGHHVCGPGPGAQPRPLPRGQWPPKPIPSFLVRGGENQAKSRSPFPRALAQRACRSPRPPRGERVEGAGRGQCQADLGRAVGHRCPTSRLPWATHRTHVDTLTLTIAEELKTTPEINPPKKHSHKELSQRCANLGRAAREAVLGRRSDVPPAGAHRTAVTVTRGHARRAPVRCLAHSSCSANAGGHWNGRWQWQPCAGVWGPSVPCRGLSPVSLPCAASHPRVTSRRPLRFLPPR